MTNSAKACAWLLSAFVVSNINIASALAQTTDQITQDNCKVCAQVCTTTLNYCNDKRGRYGEATMTNALKDAITACKTAQDFIARGSKLQGKFSSICTDACYTCAKACESFKQDTTMRACADECRKCGGNCTKVSNAQ